MEQNIAAMHPGASSLTLLVSCLLVLAVAPAAGEKPSATAESRWATLPKDDAEWKRAMSPERAKAGLGKRRTARREHAYDEGAARGAAPTLPQEAASLADWEAAMTPEKVKAGLEPKRTELTDELKEAMSPRRAKAGLGKHRSKQWAHAYTDDTNAGTPAGADPQPSAEEEFQQAMSPARAKAGLGKERAKEFAARYPADPRELSEQA